MDKLDRFARYIIYISTAVFVFSAILFLWKDYEISFSLPINETKFEAFGSFISGFLAFAGVILFYLALREQRKDIQTNRKALSHQIEEFKLQRIELEETRKVYIEQSLTQKTQRFENTFFQLLNLHHDIVNSIALRNSEQKVYRNGRDCFETLHNLLRRKFDRIKNEDDTNVIDFYLEIYEESKAVLSHYFRNLYHIYKFVHNSDIEDKHRYSAFIRAQLSTFELLLLFYNCLSPNGNEKFKPLIEEYSTFKNLDISLIGGGKDVVKQYKPSAYKRKNFNHLKKIQDWF